MDNTDLLAAINSLSRDSLGGTDTELSSDRAQAMDHYHGLGPTATNKKADLK